jgi:hypothetical protein
MHSNKLSNLVSSEKGQTLAFTLIFMTCILMIGTSLFSLYDARARLNTSYIHTYDAQYGDETGLNRFVWALNNEPYNVAGFLAQNNNTYSGYSAEGNYYYNVTATTQSTSLTPSLINLTGTGWYANDPSHPFGFTAQVKERQFCQYLYFTQQETADDGTTPVYWGPGDDLRGGLFTNGIIHTTDNTATSTTLTPTFEDVVKFNDNGATQDQANADQLNASAIPNYVSGGISTEFKGMSPPTYLPSWSAPYTPPANNSELIPFANDPQGYYFQGRTCIWLTGNTFYYDNQGSGRQGPCALPANGVIYVDNNGETDTNYPITQSNYKAEDTQKFDMNLGNVFVSGTLHGQLTIGAANNIYLTAGDPTSTYAGTPDFVTYSNTTFNGGGNEYAGATGTDMLGLVANNYIEILRWGWPTDSGHTPIAYPVSTDYNTVDQYVYSPQGGGHEPELDAAVMALKYTFCYEDAGLCFNPYPQPAAPTMFKLVGAVMQYYRGIMSANDLAGYDLTNSFAVCLGDGYVKDYWYDPRMAYESPPHYVQPTGNGWGILSWTNTPGVPLTFPAAASIAGVNITGAAPLAAGTPEQLSAVVTPGSVNAVTTPQTVNWSLSDPSNTGTTIDPSGYLTAGTHTGTVTVTATSNVYPSISHTVTIVIH